MRKVFCDGCKKELVEHAASTFLRDPLTIFLDAMTYDGKEIMWCRSCTKVACEAVAQRSKEDA